MSDKSKWSRIPVSVYELQQRFCAWRWDNLPCGAGDNSNYVLYSRDFGVNTFWTTVGSPTTGTAAWLGLDERLGFNNYVEMAASDAVGVAFADLPLLPTFTAADQDFFGSFYYQEAAGGVSQLQVDANFYYVGAGGTGVIQKAIIIDPTTHTVVSHDAVFTEITITPGAGGTLVNPWARMTYKFNPAAIIPAGFSYAISSGFAASPTGSGVVRVIAPQISKDILSDYRQTTDSAKVANAAPCFNTLSSCQSPDDYRIDRLTDACLLSFNSTTGWNYVRDFEGTRDEGLYLEFYLGQTASYSSSFSSATILDIDGIITVSVAYNHGVDPGPVVTFSVDGGSVDYELDNGTNTYRLACYLSRGGTFRVRGVEGQVSANSFSAVPQNVFVGGSLDTLRLSIADLLLYDYEAKPITAAPSLQTLTQKGDLYGDALLYVPFKRIQGANSISGLEPDDPALAEFYGISGDTPRIDEGHLIANADGQVSIDIISGYFGRFTNAALLEPPLFLRFTERNKSSRLPETLRAIPSLVSVSNNPSQLSVGGTNENISALGSRDQSTARFIDHPYSDYLVDPYVSQRDYTPQDQGTFWGKWKARNVYREGIAIKHISGYENEAGGLEREHEYNYTLDKITGPDGRGNVTIQGYDILQELRSDRAVFPTPNTARLSADMTTGATSFSVLPTGIGDQEFGAFTGTFRVRIGGEGFDVTRSGDTFTIVGRGLYGGLDEHSEDDTVQFVARFTSQQVHNIAYFLIVATLPQLAGYINKPEWDGLAGSFLPRVYSADITEPTGVEELLKELTVTAPIYFYTDIRSNQIKLGVIREPAAVGIELDEESRIIGDSVRVQEYPKERIDEVWVYYRTRNAAESVDDLTNYSQRFILVNVEEQVNRGRRSIKRLYTRWIEAGARDTAEEIAQAYISRFTATPLRVSFDLDAKEGDIWLGDVVKLITRQQQDITGNARDDVNYQIISADEKQDGHVFSYLAQSYDFFAPIDPNVINISIQPDEADNLNPDLRDGLQSSLNLYDLYKAVIATEVPTINFVVLGGTQPDGGTVVGASVGETYSLHLPDSSYWTWAPTINLIVEPGGVVAGRGGDAGDGGGYPYPNLYATIDRAELNGKNGADGQDGFLCEYACTIDNRGIIGGGGGGGGGGGSTGSLRSSTSTNVIMTYTGGGGGGGAGAIVGDGGNSAWDQAGNSFLDAYAAVAVNDGTDGTYTTAGTGGPQLGTIDINLDLAPDGFFFGVKLIAGRGGNGGGLGEAGQPGAAATIDYINPSFFNSFNVVGSGGAGGAPGRAIVGISNVTFTNRGDIRGETI